jgi:hypothetical protein
LVPCTKAGSEAGGESEKKTLKVKKLAAHNTATASSKSKTTPVPAVLLAGGSFN